jgi:hypothetical protein
MSIGLKCKMKDYLYKIKTKCTKCLIHDLVAFNKTSHDFGWHITYNMISIFLIWYHFLGAICHHNVIPKRAHVKYPLIIYLLIYCKIPFKPSSCHISWPYNSLDYPSSLVDGASLFYAIIITFLTMHPT